MAQVTWQPFGVTAGGQAVEQWTLTAGDYTLEVLTLGGIIRSFTVPAPEGKRDIVLGCDTLAEYEAGDKYLGALIGRVANRIGGARFALNGQSYSLAANSGPNCLHGGVRGFDRVVWQAREAQGGLVLTYVSPDGEEGFPGTLTVQVLYTLTADGVLTLEYQAQSDTDTLCNLTHHSYFNLLGHSHGSLEGHQLQLWSDAITELDPNSTPTGAILPVEGTPFDLRQPVDLCQRLAQDHPQLALGHGFDHNFILHRQTRGPLKRVARATAGGLCLECYTTQPGLQLYTANFLDGEPGKQGAVYGPRSAFCLEAQGWPDAIHHPHFPSPILPAGTPYHHTTSYFFLKEKVGKKNFVLPPTGESC